MHFILRTEANPLIIALSSELQCTDMVSCIATILLYNINISLILSCSSNIIYGYHLTGKWTGAVEWTIYGMVNGIQLVTPLTLPAALHVNSPGNVISVNTVTS